MRTFTVRRFEPASGELDIDFVLHGEGPASQWAEQAKGGGVVAVAGPGGRRYAVPDVERLLIAGDETALPAIGTILESLPSGVQVQVYAEVRDSADELAWRSAAQLHVTWLHRGATGSTPVGSLLAQPLQEAQPSNRPVSVWLACEASVMRRVRNYLLEEWLLSPEHIVTRGYWKVGEPNYPDHDYGLD